MHSHPEIVMIFLAAGAVFYPLGMRLLSDWAQPSRVQMADMATALLTSSCLNDRQKDTLDSMLDDAFKSRFMIFVALYLPVYIFRRLRNKARTELPVINDPETKRIFDAFVECHFRIIVAANPFFTLIVAFEVALLAFVLLPVGMMNNLVDLLPDTIFFIENHGELSQ